MLKYYYMPLDATIEEEEVLRVIYKNCVDMKDCTCSYSLNSIANDCDTRLGITKRKVETILNNFEAKGWIRYIEKGVGRGKSILQVTFKDCINK